jgi:wobble nucleotide-excising tRNase
LLSQHEAEINRLLACFGARFRIVQTKPSFAGGAASSTYRLSLNDQTLDLGDQRTPKGQPCFRTALSAGDKSALGLAFFLAKIRRDPVLSSKLIVFDDPLSSFDLFRQSYTQQEITRIADGASQVVVLSHDPYFLKGIRDNCESGIKTLMIGVKGTGFTIREWNIEEWCLNQNHKDFFVLQRFLRGNSAPGADLVNVARSIRPYVEGALRFRFPSEFAGARMLGAMIELVRKSTGGALDTLKADLSTLEDLNNYSRSFHHGDSQPSSAPNETELRTFACRALDYVRGS